MTIIWTIFIGFVIGLIARAVLPGRDPAGFIITTVVGISGALIGSLIGRALGFYSDGQPASFVMSVVGAVALLAGYRYMVPATSVGKP
jgi:uncharacterized membrane protein YeaQ/YmgE (transglycosylase-associated protein family)